MSPNRYSCPALAALLRLLAEWTLRRVEKVILDRDRSLSRDITVDFCIRPDAPTFRTSDGRRLRLVPLSMMHRRTLVNLSIRSESRDTVPMPGIRFTQQLDESILLAAIAAHHPEIAATRNCRTWVHRAISGTLGEVLAAYRAFDGKIDLRPETSFLEELRRDELITSTVNRFRTAFTLYVLMDDDNDDRHRRPSHRLLRIAFEEPIRQERAVRNLSRPEWPFPLGVCSRLDGGCTRVNGCPTADGPQPQRPAHPAVQVSRR